MYALKHEPFYLRHHITLVLFILVQIPVCMKCFTFESCVLAKNCGINDVIAVFNNVEFSLYPNINFALFDAHFIVLMSEITKFAVL